MEHQLKFGAILIRGMAILLILGGLLWLAGCDVPVDAQVGGPGGVSAPVEVIPEVIPEGFQVTKSAEGIRLFKKTYKNGTPDFVQIVSLDQGASVELLHGSVTAERSGKGVFGGNDARFQSQSLKKFWNVASRLSDQVFCVTNGQFFYMPESPTRLTLPLKVDGQVITDGFGADQFIGKRLMLELWQGHADIRELSAENLYNSSAPDVIGGLSAEANRRAKDYTGRTFVGVQDRDRDGLHEILYVFNTRTARQVDADAVLRSFGAEKTMMLDGGGSTQLICQDENIITSERAIPQALAMIAGDLQVDITNAAVISEPSQDEGNSLEDRQLVVQEPAQTMPEQSFDAQPPTDQSASLGANTTQTAELVELGNPAYILIIIIPVGFLVLFFVTRIRRMEEDY